MASLSSETLEGGSNLSLVVPLLLIHSCHRAFVTQLLCTVSVFHRCMLMCLEVELKFCELLQIICSNICLAGYIIMNKWYAGFLNIRWLLKILIFQIQIFIYSATFLFILISTSKANGSRWSCIELCVHLSDKKKHVTKPRTLGQRICYEAPSPQLSLCCWMPQRGIGRTTIGQGDPGTEISN